MKAYNGDPKLKSSLIQQMRAHREAEQLIQGGYWRPQEERGCAVACLTHDPDGGHERYETDWGIPERLAHLEDAIFEGLPVERAKMWPERFLEAIRPGADLSKVWHQWASRVLRRHLFPIVKRTTAARRAVERVANLHTRAARRPVAESKWKLEARVCENIEWRAETKAFSRMVAWVKCATKATHRLKRHRRDGFIRDSDNPPAVRWGVEVSPKTVREVMARTNDPVTRMAALWHSEAHRRQARVMGATARLTWTGIGQVAAVTAGAAHAMSSGEAWPSLATTLIELLERAQ